MSEVSAFGVVHNPEQVSKSLKLLVRAGGSRGSAVPKKAVKGDAVRRKAPPHISRIGNSDVSKKSVGHKLRKLVHRIEGPRRSQVRSAIRRSKVKPPSKQRLKELDDIAVHNQAMSNPTSAEVARRAKKAHGTYHYDKSGPLRPHEPKPTGEQAKKIALSRANLSLRHYGPLTPVTKRDALKHHKKLERKYDRRSNMAIVGAPASMAGSWLGSTAIERLGDVKRGPIGRLNAKAPGAMKAVASKPAAAIAGGLGTGASLVAAGHYGRKANKHGAIARGIETRRNNKKA
jgi:hypothetical protein